MQSIHPTAIIGKNVELGVNNFIGANVTIEDGVRIGAHNKILSGAYLCSGTELGNYNEIHMYAVIGHTPQDTGFKGETSYTRIGNENIIREFVTIHRGTLLESETLIGDSNLIMAYCHIAHNCQIGNRVTMVNQSSLSGYCTVEDHAFISGMTGFHQFTRIGRLAMVSGLSACNKDVPPYMTCGGRPAVVLGINAVGLRRAGFTAEERLQIKQAYKFLYRSKMNTQQAVAAMKNKLPASPVQHLIAFIMNSKRGLLDSGAEIEETLLPRKKNMQEKDEN